MAEPSAFQDGRGPKKLKESDEIPMMKPRKSRLSWTFGLVVR